MPVKPVKTAYEVTFFCDLVIYSVTPTAASMLWEPFATDNQLPRLKLVCLSLAEMEKLFADYFESCKKIAASDLKEKYNGIRCWVILSRGQRKPSGFKKARETKGRLKFGHCFDEMIINAHVGD